jgi:hypothetical protein
MAMTLGGGGAPIRARAQNPEAHRIAYVIEFLIFNSADLRPAALTAMFLILI